ncbi:MAG: WYL domain-containing protein [Acidobacteria bacterium]|nr:WYL domain-containing protein [Acidobacteriota bacterium]
MCVEIQCGGYPTKADLAQIIERTPRTVQTYLRALENDFDAPIAFDHQKNGFYFTDPAWRLPKFTLTQGELISFFASERFLRLLGSASEAQPARRALKRLAELLPEEVTVDLNALEDAISFAPEPVLDASPKILSELAAAATNRQTLHINYYSQHRNAHTERDVDVLLVHNHLGEWYAVCRDHSDEGRIKDFHAGRISKITETRRAFTPPDDWPEEKERYLRRGFGMFRGGKEVVVEVEFDSYQARYARERSFHPTQRRDELSDGRLRVTFETTEAALEQVARWLMQYGEHAVAVRPASLQEMVQERLQRTIERYDNFTNEAEQ